MHSKRIRVIVVFERTKQDKLRSKKHSRDNKNIHTRDGSIVACLLGYVKWWSSDSWILSWQQSRGAVAAMQRSGRETDLRGHWHSFACRQCGMHPAAGKAFWIVLRWLICMPPSRDSLAQAFLLNGIWYFAHQWGQKRIDAEFGFEQETDDMTDEQTRMCLFDFYLWGINWPAASHILPLLPNCHRHVAIRNLACAYHIFQIFLCIP